MKKKISIKDWVALLIGVLMLAYMALQFVPTFTYMDTVSHSKVKAVKDADGNIVTPEIPKWSENVVSSTSIFSYLALPSDYKTLTGLIEDKYEENQHEYSINDVVGICLLLQFLAIAGFVLNILAQKSFFTPLLGIVWGIVGFVGYLSNLFLKLGQDFRTVGDIFTHTNPATNTTTSIVVGELAQGAAVPEGSEVVVSALANNASTVYTLCLVLFGVVCVLSCYRMACWIINRSKEREAYNKEMAARQAALAAERNGK